MATASTAVSTWQLFSDHLNRWYYKPDLKAVEVAITVAASHYLSKSDPVWLFVVGPSSSGKTSIIINALRDLDSAHVLGDLTSKTFISNHGGKPCGILNQIKNGMFLFKDFTTLLNKREDERAEIMAQLREIYDGCWQRNTGTVELGAPWRGRVTTIACTTEALERAWGVKRDMGERFVTVRWPRIGTAAMARAASKQRGREEQIAKRTSELGSQLVKQAATYGLGELPEDISERCANLSELVAHMRGHVIRASYGQREIIDVPTIEEPGRLNKALEMIVCANAALHNRQPDMDSYRLAVRVGWDTMPPARRLIIECLAEGALMRQAEMVDLIGMSQSSLRYHAEEMAALNIIRILVDPIKDTVSYKITDNCRDLIHNSISAVERVKKMDLKDLRDDFLVQEG